jgi:nucleoside-diphosphate kinase
VIERTLVILKPDCVQRRLVGRVLSRLEQKGLNFVAMKLVRVGPGLAKEHYREHVNKPFYPSLEQFITAAPVLAAVVEGPSAVKVVRAMLGPTSGTEAPAGTIRGDFSLSRQMNLVHGSDSPESAAREIAIWFRDEELCPYRPDLACWLAAADEWPEQE